MALEVRKPDKRTEVGDLQLELHVRRVEAESFATRVHTESYRITRLIAAGLLVEANQVAAGLNAVAGRHLRRNAA